MMKEKDLKLQLEREETYKHGKKLIDMGKIQIHYQKLLALL